MKRTVEIVLRNIVFFSFYLSFFFYPFSAIFVVFFLFIISFFSSCHICTKKPGFHAVRCKGTIPRFVQIETWFFGIIHCISLWKWGGHEARRPLFIAYVLECLQSSDFPRTPKKQFFFLHFLRYAYHQIQNGLKCLKRIQEKIQNKTKSFQN